MKYPKYIKTSDGYIGTFQYLDFGEFPVYRFEGGDRIADNWELANGSDNREELVATNQQNKKIWKILKNTIDNVKIVWYNIVTVKRTK